jgi:bacterioferritin-associated ferredoxin
MFVCSCNVFTDHQVRAVAGEAGSVGEVYRCLGCRPQCGVCARTIRKLLDEARREAACACPQVCAPEETSCPVVERALEIARSLDIDEAGVAHALTHLHTEFDGPDGHTAVDITVTTDRPAPPAAAPG